MAGLPPLREADEKEAKFKSSIEGLAVGQFDIHGEITIVLYDPEKMKTAIEGISDFSMAAKSPVGEMPKAIMGMIRISPPAYGRNRDENSCHGAWEVVRSSVRTKGVGIGLMLHKLAVAASPTGKIMPDRRDISSDAQDFWQKNYSKIEKKKIEKKNVMVFDDENNPKTEDPSDDCVVHPYDKKKGPGSNFLNYAYDDFGENINIDALYAAHQDFMNEVSPSLPDNVNINKVFYKAASKAFLEMID